MEAERTINVAIVTPYPVVSRGLISLLEHEEDFSVIGTARTPDDALDLFREKSLPYVALIDLAVGDHDPHFAFVSRTRERYAQLPIVTVSQSNAPVYGELARKAGAQEHLSYHCAAKTLREMLQCASRVTLPAKPLTQPELEGFTPPSDSSPPPVLPVDERRLLTPRQRQIYDLLGNGEKYDTIATILNILPRTVGMQYSAMAKRLGCADSRDVLRMAVRRALLLELGREDSAVKEEEKK